MDFTSRQLRAFLLVAQHRSFTRAAQALFLTPSALSLLIRELETQLGFRLFDRTTRLVVPTSYGNELLAVAQRSLADWDTATSRIGRSAVQASRSLSLGAAPLISANVITPAIREFRGHRPNLRIQLFDGSQIEILQRIEAGKLDMGLGVFAPTPGTRRTPFFRFSLMVIRPQKDVEFRPASTTWSALKGATLICLPQMSPIQRVVDKNLVKAGVTFRRGAVVNLLDTQIAMVEADEGVAIIPSFGLPACRNRRVVMIRLTNPVVNLEFYQISNRAQKLLPEAEEFTSFLKSYIARWAGRAGVL
ncbi:MAG: LysR family transcriptional regulator [Acidobacteria bacterium]|nr:LysR family transcriptional regulator [Acidobacteriota bacterium]